MFENPYVVWGGIALFGLIYVLFAGQGSDKISEEEAKEYFKQHPDAKSVPVVHFDVPYTGNGVDPLAILCAIAIAVLFLGYLFSLHSSH